MSGEEIVLDAQAVEEPVGSEGEPVAQPSRLPAPPSPAELDAWRGEVRAAAIAAATGLVAGAATVAAVRAVRSPRRAAKPRRALRRRPAEQSIVASRSFLVDVHILGNR